MCAAFLREQIPPCLSCWAVRGWCAAQSSQTRRHTETWPWSLWLWSPEGRNKGLHVMQLYQTSGFWGEKKKCASGVWAAKRKIKRVWRNVFVVGVYLRVAVGEDQLVVDSHRFPLRQRFDQQFLFDLKLTNKKIKGATRNTGHENEEIYI